MVDIFWLMAVYVFWLVVDGGRYILAGGGWLWVLLDGGGWQWVVVDSGGWWWAAAWFSLTQT